jgi:hypothetical protein
MICLNVSVNIIYFIRIENFNILYDSESLIILLVSSIGFTDKLIRILSFVRNT